jgi:electron transfer flavoprotein alpha subunit
MDSILLLLHTEKDDRIRKSGLEALEVVRQLGKPFQIGIVGRTAEAALAQLAGCGASRVLAVEGEAFGVSRYSSDCPAVVALFEATLPGLVIAACTPRWARALPGAAARMGGATDTHITGLDVQEGAMQAKRWFYRQRIEAVLEREERPWFLLLESGIASAFVAEGEAPSAERITVPVVTRSEVRGLVSPEVGGDTIRPEAAVLFVAGAGWTKKQKDGALHIDEAGQLIEEFIQNADASLGSSKSLVDLSGEGHAVLPFLSHLNQVGQTGSTPRHPRGLATCCHGEEPHVVGWRFIQDRRAVNLDANCGWARGKADVLYVADAFEVMRKLNALLR